jgi:hypothetical protein
MAVTEAVGLRCVNVPGVQTAEAGRAVAASAREMNKTLQEVQQGYESYGAKLAEHEGKLRRLLGEYGVLAAGQDRTMEKLRSECGEAVGAAVQAAARLEQVLPSRFPLRRLVFAPIIRTGSCHHIHS